MEKASSYLRLFVALENIPKLLRIDFKEGMGALKSFKQGGDTFCFCQCKTE